MHFIAVQHGSSKIYLCMFLAKYAQGQWNKLKENYRKCMKRRDKATRSGAGKTQLLTCQYYRELAFITDTISNKPTTSNVPIPDIFTPPASPHLLSQMSPAVVADNSDVSQTQHDNHSIPTSNTTPTSTTVSTAKKRKTSKNDFNGLLMASIQRDLSVPPLKTTEEKDPDTLFCLSLVHEFKDLSNKKKRLARVKMMQVFCELHEDDDG